MALLPLIHTSGRLPVWIIHLINCLITLIHLLRAGRLAFAFLRGELGDSSFDAREVSTDAP